MHIIKKAKIQDLNEIAKISSENFSGLKDTKNAKRWIKCNFLAYPRTQYFVARTNGKISGYILWIEHGGFRKEAVWELEQIAVGKNYQGQGTGTKLIEKSLSKIKKHLEKRKSALKAVKITTRVNNRAQALYKKTLGAEVESIIKDLFRGDEVIMIARFTDQ